MRRKLLFGEEDALPKDCSNLFRDYIPMVPYPCFSTLTPGGGSMIGHPLDPNERPAILLGQDLLDAMTRPRGGGEDLFVGTRHVDTSIMGFACGQGTAASPRVGQVTGASKFIPWHLL